MIQKTKLELLEEGHELGLYQLSNDEVRELGFIKFAVWSACPGGQMRNHRSFVFFYNPEKKMILAQPGGLSLTSDDAYWRVLSASQLAGFDDGNLTVTDPKIFEMI